MIPTKTLFKIRLTLIGTSSDCKNAIVLFVFSFILLFLLPPHKRDLTLKACALTIFLLFENTLKSGTNLEFFKYESIKARSFDNKGCFNQELLCFFSILRCRNNKISFWLLSLLSSDISLNPVPINGFEQYNSNQWVVFKKRGLHFLRIKVAGVVDLKLVFTVYWFFYNLVVLIKLCKIRYLN